MSTGIEIQVLPQYPPPSVSKCGDEERGEVEPLLLPTTMLDSWGSAPQLKPRHTIFLSHSGAQKNFVEQLCEDLERAKQVPFFDKRPESLPKGEKFAQLIFQAAQQCELAIVVVSEEYFSRSKWPMLELVAFVQAGKCAILPLFLGLSCKEFGDAKRRQAWFQRWNEWALQDPRIEVSVWKDALRDLDGRNGLEYNEALGEVPYRREVVATACAILEKNAQLKDQELPQWALNLFKILGGLIFKVCFFIVFAIIFFRVIFPFITKFIMPSLEEMARPPPPMPKVTCTLANGKPIKCPDFSDVFNKP